MKNDYKLNVKWNEYPYSFLKKDVRCYTRPQINNIIETLSNSSYTFIPHYYTNKIISVTKHEKINSCSDTEIHCLVIRLEDYRPCKIIKVKENTEGINMLVSYIWEFIKKVYSEDLNIDIDVMSLGEGEQL